MARKAWTKREGNQFNKTGVGIQNSLKNRIKGDLEVAIMEGEEADMKTGNKMDSINNMRAIVNGWRSLKIVLKHF